MSVSLRMVVFARNESPVIRRALDSACDAVSSDPGAKIFVLVNGCTDSTPQIVAEYARRRRMVTVITLPFGDKCNAWNAYVHRHADDAAAHFFMDGDVRCAPGSVVKMAKRLLNDPTAVTVAGMPLAGRECRLYQQYVIQRRWVFGGLYGVKGSFLNQIRELGLRLPLGLSGSDHQLTRLVKTCLPNPAALDDQRVCFEPDCGYEFRSLQPHSPRDWGIYIRRQATYRLRYYQLCQIGELPVTQLPRTMDVVNLRILGELSASGMEWNPIDWMVRRRLQRMYPMPDSLFFQRLLPLAA